MPPSLQNSKIGHDNQDFFTMVLFPIHLVDIIHKLLIMTKFDYKNKYAK